MYKKKGFISYDDNIYNYKSNHYITKQYVSYNDYYMLKNEYDRLCGVHNHAVEYSDTQDRRIEKLKLESEAKDKIIQENIRVSLMKELEKEFEIRRLKTVMRELAEKTFDLIDQNEQLRKQ